MWGFISEKIGQSIFCDCRNCTMNYMLWIDLNKIFSARVRRRRIKEVIVEY